MTDPTTLPVRIKIGSTYVTDYLDFAAFPPQWVSALDQELDTLNLTLINADAVAPVEWQEVKIDYLTGDLWLTIFGGYVITVDQKPGSDPTDNNYVLGCSDYGAYLSRVFLKKEYKGYTDAGIIADIFTVCPELSGFNETLCVHALRTIPIARFNHKSIAEIMDWLCDQTGGHWYVDQYKYVHYFGSEENVHAPYDVTDDPTDAAAKTVQGVTASLNGANVANRVEVVGGNYLSPDTTFYAAGTGSSKVISLPFRLQAPDGQTAVQIWRNDGTQASPVWTLLTTKTGYINTITLTTEVLYYYQERAIEQLNNWPNLPNAVKITGKYEIPLLTRVRNKASYDHYGRWLQLEVFAPEISDRDTAILRGQIELARNAFAHPAVTYTTLEPGLEAGQMQHINLPARNLDGDYLIQRVTTTIGVGGLISAFVELGAVDANLIRLLMNMKRESTPESDWRDDEVLNEVFDFSETGSLVEDSHLVTATQTPYKWGTAKWGYAKWS